MSYYSNFAEFAEPGKYRLSIPENVNTIKVYLVGAGGGGGGGGGGFATNKSGYTDKGGGGGGSGGSGEIGFFVQQNVSDKNIFVSVGRGGVGGLAGFQGRSGVNTSLIRANGKRGIKGGDGNETFVKIGKDINLTVQSGKGGNPGKGAKLNDSINGTGGDGGDGIATGQKGNDGSGITGGNGGIYVSPITNNTSYGNLSVSNAGIYPDSNPGKSGSGGNGGNSNERGNMGQKGNNGYVRIYYL